MSRSQSSSGKPKRSSFETELYNNFADLLEHPRKIPWQKSWVSMERPQNYFTGKEYQGANVFNLMITAMLRGYSDPRWLTIGKIKKDPDLYIKAGSKASYVEYVFVRDPTQHDAQGRVKTLPWDDFERLKQKAKTDPAAKQHLDRVYISRRSFPVFNASCVEGTTPYIAPGSRDTSRKLQGEKLFQAISEQMGVKLILGQGDKSYYVPAEDKVVLPDSTWFHSPNGYIYTGLHEFCHASGSENRLNREQVAMFGSPSYAREELVAEMGSVDAASRLGIRDLDDVQLQNSQSYVTSWLRACKDKPRDLIDALRDADKAAEFVTANIELEKLFPEVEGVEKAPEPAPEPENKKNMSAPEIRETSAVEPDQWQKETIPPVDSDYKLVSYSGERIDENYIDGLTHSDGKPKETDVSVSGTEPSQEVLDRRIKSTERLLQMNNLPEDVKNELQETLTAYQDARAVDDQGVFPMPVRFRTGEESLPMLDILAQGIFRESALCFAEMAKDPDVGSPAIIQADKVLRADFCSGKLTSPKILENNENRKYQFHSQPEREPVSTDRENR